MNSYRVTKEKLQQFIKDNFKDIYAVVFDKADEPNVKIYIALDTMPINDDTKDAIELRINNLNNDFVMLMGRSKVDSIDRLRDYSKLINVAHTIMTHVNAEWDAEWEGVVDEVLGITTGYKNSKK